MESQRWQCKELNALDLMPERNLLTFFVTSPKEPDVASEFLQFKTDQSRSRKHVLYKYQPPAVRQKELLKSVGPRFDRDLPEPVDISVLRPHYSKKKYSSSPHYEAEALIEDMIRNRQEITLPNIPRPTSPYYGNIKERFLKTRSLIVKDRNEKCESLLQNIKESIRSKSYNVEKETSYWDKQPIRKWDVRSIRVLQQTRFKSKGKSSIFLKSNDNDEDFVKKMHRIEDILDNCKTEISNWAEN